MASLALEAAARLGGGSYHGEEEIPGNLPMMERLVSERFRGSAPLRGVTAVLIQHQLGDIVARTNALIQLGLSPGSIHWIDIPYSEGAVHLDERARAHALMGLLALASIDAERRGLDHFPTSAELVQLLPVLPRPIRLSVVALPSPSDTPPAGSIGYYSDGARHAAAVVVSARGRRLFLEVDVDDVVRSNVIGYIFGDD